MAVISGSGSVSNESYFLHTWEEVGNGDTGEPIRKSGLGDKTVQVLGTFGSGGSVSIEGSMDNETWAVLTNGQGDNLTFTAAGIRAIGENPKFLRPNVTAGDGTTELSIHIGASALK